MKTRSRLFLLLGCPVLGTTVGWLSYVILPTPAAETSAAPVSHRREGTRDPREREAPAKWTGEDFFQHMLASFQSTEDGGFPPFIAATADWTDAEIRAALDEAMRDPQTFLEPWGLKNYLIQEYMRRDLDAAIGWFSAQTDLHRMKLASIIASHWPQSRALEGVEFIRANKSFYEGYSNSPGDLIAKAAVQISGQGAAAVAELLKGLADEGFVINLSGDFGFSREFDFGGLLGDARFQQDVGDFSSLRLQLVEEWARQNRDAAFAWLAVHRQGFGWENELLHLSRRENGGPQDTSTWFIGKLAELPGKQQDQLIQWRTIVQSGSSDEMLGWLEAAPTEDLRARIRPAIAQGMFHGESAKVISMMESMPDAESRLRLLETVNHTSARMVLPMEAEAAERLRARLREWGATPDRAAAIVPRYTKG